LRARVDAFRVVARAGRKIWRSNTMTAGPVRHRDLDLCLEGPGPPLSLLFPSGKATECSTSSTAALHAARRVPYLESTYLVLYFQPSLVLGYLEIHAGRVSCNSHARRRESQFIYTVSGIVDA
jgi:hypothetical protein